MKFLTYEPEEKRWYLHLGKHIFAHLVNDWSQLVGKYNWYTFHLLHLSLENDIMMDGWECECVVLGLGFRLRVNRERAEDSETQRVIDRGMEEIQQYQMRQTMTYEEKLEWVAANNPRIEWEVRRYEQYFSRSLLIGLFFTDRAQAIDWLMEQIQEELASKKKEGKMDE